VGVGSCNSTCVAASGSLNRTSAKEVLGAEAEHTDTFAAYTPLTYTGSKPGYVTAHPDSRTGCLLDYNIKLRGEQVWHLHALLTQHSRAARARVGVCTRCLVACSCHCRS
jgi:hypothetical protein